ncbi:hypothetical protein F4821DRAFT_228320 [Hypoxylon rubiginosum]|uniref:Uncharacterized protein n=1 Tax=Hypoxylon rubiginosum TaxID=110542 RepID=A0ACC0DF69_9PEZI|nr:hypothetical protein F4821DRAFT_228320 [Hypoxylon rubiginosum]
MREDKQNERMDDLSDLLDWHISKKNRIFSGYGISKCDYEGQAWATVTVSVDGKPNESGVIQILRRLENDIDQLVAQDQKPERLTFCVMDDSNHTYWAKSRSVRGTLSARDAARQMEVPLSIGSEIELEDGEKTRPSTPQPEMEKIVIEVKL